MRHLVNLWLRLKALVLRRRLERDLEEELSFHLAMREAQYASSGVAGTAAQEAARRRFGNPTQYKEQLRDMWTFPSFERRGASYPDFLDWRAQATSFDGMAACD